MDLLTVLGWIAFGGWLVLGPIILFVGPTRIQYGIAWGVLIFNLFVDVINR